MRKIVAMFFGLMLCFAITGCGIHCNVGTEIKSTGACSTKLQLVVDEEMYSLLTSYSDDADYSNLQLIPYNGETWYGYETTRELESIDQLKEVFVNGDNPLFTSFEVSTTELKGTLVDDFFNLKTEDIGEYANLIDSKINLSFTFPYEIEETNGVISEDKHTVTWSLGNTNGTEIYVKTKSPATLYIIIAVAGVILIGIIVFIIVHKKRNKTTEPTSETV